ncbi:MAG: sulfotransferase domain-containing protein [Gemmataceae bacterium]|nr:sulfotransferase domain-containing protein [Gemmata sp.]MDW8197328.1 sulfotransferase domain-containing protein [Gemmataceae bacterium]
MIVWLASYPRSGNTLLRQVLKCCFNLNSCEGLEPVPEHLRNHDAAREDYYGSYFVNGNPEEFYQQAHTSADLVLIKSHQLPRDNNKAIYVVRDGRLALQSFVKFQDTFHPGESTFESLLLGDHPYGDWSSHYHAWCAASRGPTFVVRFEELLNANANLLRQLQEFLGYSGPVHPWVNPQAQLRKLTPTFYGHGRPTWQPDEFWTEVRLRQFYTLHGALLIQLGYATPADVDANAYPVGCDEERMLQFTRQLVHRHQQLQRIADQRLAEIQRLDAACTQRLAVIAELTRSCDERLAIIQRLERDLERSRRTTNTQRRWKLVHRVAVQLGLLNP